jgi:hypothetical protein
VRAFMGASSVRRMLARTPTQSPQSQTAGVSVNDWPPP